MCTNSWGRASYVRAMVELRANVDLKYTIIVVVPKFVGEGYNLKNIRVEYEWTPPRCSCCKVFGHIMDECPKKPISDMLKSLKNTRQAVDSTDNVDSTSEAEEVFDETAGFMASTSLKGDSESGYGTKSLLEQWRETKVDDDYNLYNDDLYDGYDMSDKLQSICDDFDITVRG
ncbi:zinc knuckle CX2CX4HX4C containing protein [Tanacetum coccineum]